MRYLLIFLMLSVFSCSYYSIECSDCTFKGEKIMFNYDENMKEQKKKDEKK